MAVDAPAGGVAVQPLLVRGWALDPQASAGSGIDAVHVWAFQRDRPGATRDAVVANMATALRLHLDDDEKPTPSAVEFVA